MDAVVVDTSVASLPLKLKPDTREPLHAQLSAGRARVMSFMTLAELFYWERSDDWGERRRAPLREFVATFIIDRFDERLCETWADITYAGKRSGRPIAPDDAWIAATALSRGIPLVTDNPRDFEAVPGLTVLTARR